MTTLLAVLFLALLPALVSWIYDGAGANGFVGHLVLGWQCVLFAAVFLTVAAALLWLFALSVSVLVGNV